MESWLKKILNFARETGDRCIIIDPVEQESFVIMTLEQYTKLRQAFQPGLALPQSNQLQDLTEEQLLNKINGEIDTWKSYQNEQTRTDVADVADPYKRANTSDFFGGSEGETSVMDEKFYFEPVDESK